MKGLVPPQLISQQSNWSGPEDIIQIGIGENPAPEGGEYVVWQKTQPRHGEGVDMEAVIVTDDIQEAVDTYNLTAEGLTVHGYRSPGPIYITADQMLRPTQFS